MKFELRNYAVDRWVFWYIYGYGISMVCMVYLWYSYGYFLPF